MTQRISGQLGLLGYHYAVAGRQTEAGELLKEVEEQYAQRKAVGQSVAVIYEGLGDRDQAFAWLEKDFEQHSSELAYVVIRPQFDRLRADPRWAVVRRRMGLNP